MFLTPFSSDVTCPFALFTLFEFSDSIAAQASDSDSELSSSVSKVSD